MKIRWQDWFDVVIGVWLIGSPWILGFWLDKPAMGNACGVGVGLIVYNLMCAARQTDSGQEIINILLGLWLIASPFALGFSAQIAQSVNVALTGCLVVVLAIWQLRDATR